tara:strand:+ start:2428 stop:2796 length:369 start_codon:yes stop_codon:yes gene_type:complete
MMETPEPVLLWIPLMKELGMSWTDIKNAPAFELRGILAAYHAYEDLHSMDGYSDSEISDMAKNKPEIRQNWHRYKETQRKYQDMMIGNEKMRSEEARQIGFGRLEHQAEAAEETEEETKEEE